MSRRINGNTNSAFETNDSFCIFLLKYSVSMTACYFSALTQRLSFSLLISEVSANNQNCKNQEYGVSAEYGDATERALSTEHGVPAEYDDAAKHALSTEHGDATEHALSTEHGVPAEHDAAKHALSTESIPAECAEYGRSVTSYHDAARRNGTCSA
jgi:hypothetical protein